MIKTTALTAALFTLSFSAHADDYRISDPVTHNNLSIWFVEGPSASGPVPLTLQEAFEAGTVRVIETGDVNNLKIQNTGDKEIFIQSGDIVKGGQQDRVLSVSMILEPNSQETPIEAFCVEQSRWAQRGDEDVNQFAASKQSLPTREAKIAMKVKSPAPTKSSGMMQQRSYGGGDDRQGKVWQNVSKIQGDLSEKLETEVNAAASPSSLQLALENDDLNETIETYVSKFDKTGREKTDFVGYVVAVNGKLSSADVYPSHGLHLKMWEKNLEASVTEAVAAETDETADTPSKADVLAFLDDGGAEAEQEEVVVTGIRLKTRETDKAYAFSTERADGEWVHRNVLAKQ